MNMNVLILTVVSPGMIDLEETLKVKKTDEEYFPPLPDFKYPDLPLKVLEDRPTYKEGVKRSMQKLREVPSSLVTT